jgi:hypothetical protein
VSPILIADNDRTIHRSTAFRATFDRDLGDQQIYRVAAFESRRARSGEFGCHLWKDPAGFFCRYLSPVVLTERYLFAQYHLNQDSQIWLAVNTQHKQQQGSSHNIGVDHAGTLRSFCEQTGTAIALRMSTSRESDLLLPTTSATTAATTTTSGYYFLNKSDPSYTGGSTRAVKDVDDAGQVVDVPPSNSDPQEFAPRPVGKHKVRRINPCTVRIVSSGPETTRGMCVKNAISMD